MRKLAALSALLLLAGCAQPATGTVVDVTGYLVSRDSDLTDQLPGDDGHTVTCTGGKNVHMVALRDASEWSQATHWRVLAGDRTTLAIQVDVTGTTVHVFSCLAPGETVTGLRYERGSELLATAVVDVEPTMAA